MFTRGIGYHLSLRKYPMIRPKARASSIIATYMSMSASRVSLDDPLDDLLRWPAVQARNLSDFFTTRQALLLTSVRVVVAQLSCHCFGVDYHSMSPIESRSSMCSSSSS